MKFDEDDTVIVNTVYQSSPVVIHGNGPSKILLNSLGNYLAKSWVYGHDCLACKENTKDLKELEVRNLLFSICFYQNTFLAVKYL